MAASLATTRLVSPERIAAYIYGVLIIDSVVVAERLLGTSSNWAIFITGLSVSLAWAFAEAGVRALEKFLEARSHGDKPDWAGIRRASFSSAGAQFVGAVPVVTPYAIFSVGLAGPLSTLIAVGILVAIGRAAARVAKSRRAWPWMVVLPAITLAMEAIIILTET